MSISSIVEISRRLDFAIAPSSVAASHVLKALIVAHREKQGLTLVDLMSRDLARIEYSLAISPDVVLVSPIGETVAILDESQGKLEIHALKRRQILLQVSDVQTSSELTFNPDGSTLYWVDQSSGTLNAVDLWNRRQSIRLARDGSRLSAMSRSVDGTLGFVSNADTGALFIVDLHRFALLRDAQLGDAPQRPWGTADGQYMFVPKLDSGYVTAVSTSSGEPIYSVQAVDRPVSVNPGWIDTVAAIVGGDGEVAFLSVNDGSEIARVKLSGAPGQGIVTSDSKNACDPGPGQWLVRILRSAQAGNTLHANRPAE